MATSPNLEVTHLVANAANPEITVNEATNLLDECIAGMFTYDLLSDADYTLSDVLNSEEWKYAAIKITDTSVFLTTGRNIIVPTNTKSYVFINGTAQTLTLKTSGGTGIAVTTGLAQLLFCDGTNVIAISAAQ